MQLAGTIGRIDGDQRYAGQRSRELQQYPLWDIVGPGGNAFTGIESAEQRAGTGLRLGE